MSKMKKANFNDMFEFEPQTTNQRIAYDAWDEPGPRLRSTVTKFCQKCGSNNLKIVGSDLECTECGADVS